MRLNKKAAATAIAALAMCAVCALGAGCSDKNKEGGNAGHRDAPYGSVKKGVCVSRYNDNKASSAEKINSLNAGWYYTWGVKSNNEYIDAEFVPMIWGAKDVTAENVAYVKTNYESGKFSHLLTFNEPDLPDQADMTVDEALSYWESLQEIGIPLSSPVVSAYTSGCWLDEFMTKALARGYRIDFIAVHSYQSFYTTGEANNLKTKTLDVLYEKYRLPIWLTEFGAIDIISRDSHASSVSPNCTAANAKKYVEQTTTMLEKCGYVERYSWFLDNFMQKGDARPWEAPYTTLFNDDDSISETGKAYRDAESNKPLILETAKLANGKTGSNYSQTVSVCGGTGNYTFTATGLPAGLSISPAGVISGKPTMAGIYPVKVTVTDSAKESRKQTRTHSYSLTITA